ncbi:MAG: glutamine-hydrolyzing carbamoyl-phosphate synthase small subunit [Sphaerochaeta sp.]|uniref:glutamine-hydrolyzing carbamoyl-phosphate synthase small subunit n=1 Tax=Sphaerochaeta sp. TaxID=1972642 RepID=UPI002FC7C8AC
METRFLLLEDGALYKGRRFGAPAPHLGQGIVAGELVFNTSMTGYQEILTDPSYHGQMVVMTYPHIGNYGCDPAFDEGLKHPSGISCSALIVRSVYEGPLPMKRVSLDRYLTHHHVVGITSVDTRSLTIHLRTKGSQNAIIFDADTSDLSQQQYEAALASVRAFPHLGERDLIENVATKQVIYDPPIAGSVPFTPVLRFALVDFGIKRSIIAELYRRKVGVTLFPPDVKARTILESGCNAMLLSNGPGDPALLIEAVEMTREVITKLPVFGICLGHQLITWALGGRTIKLPYGHHGGNHPIIDLDSKACFVTSQNHGYASEEASLPDAVHVWLRNANDYTIEGLYHTAKQVCSVQFHPEASPGPQDATWIFDRFIKIAEEARS